MKYSLVKYSYTNQQHLVVYRSNIFAYCIVRLQLKYPCSTAWIIQHGNSGIRRPPTAKGGGQKHKSAKGDANHPRLRSRDARLTPASSSSSLPLTPPPPLRYGNGRLFRTTEVIAYLRRRTSWQSVNQCTRERGLRQPGRSQRRGKATKTDAQGLTANSHWQKKWQLRRTQAIQSTVS